MGFIINQVIVTSCFYCAFFLFLFINAYKKTFWPYPCFCWWCSEFQISLHKEIYKTCIWDVSNWNSFDFSQNSSEISSEQDVVLQRGPSGYSSVWQVWAKMGSRCVGSKVPELAWSVSWFQGSSFLQEPSYSWRVDGFHLMLSSQHIGMHLTVKSCACLPKNKSH